VAEKKYKNVVSSYSGASGNAQPGEALRVGGRHVRVRELPDIDGLFRGASGGAGPHAREAILDRAQQLVYDKAMFAPIWDFAFLHGVGPRVEESGLGLLAGYGFSAPYEDVKLKAR